MNGEIALNPFRRRLRKHGLIAQARGPSADIPTWTSTDTGGFVAHEAAAAARIERLGALRAQRLITEEEVSAPRSRLVGLP